jgi:ABC-2 type transport system permease protein
MTERRIATALAGRLWRQHRLALSVIAAGLAVFEFVVTRIAPLPGETGFLGGMVALLPPEVSAFVNEQLALASPGGVIAFGYLHPFFLALLGAWTIRVGVGALAGEIGRGTMDLLAARPVPRWAQVMAAWIVMAAGLVVLAAAAWVGSAIGVTLRPLGVTAARLWALPFMAVLLFVSWSSLVLLISATRREAGPAIAWASGLIATAFVVEFLARVWSPLAWARPLSLFTFYQPQSVISAGPGLADPLRFVVVALAGLAAAVFVFERRDL